MKKPQWAAVLKVLSGKSRVEKDDGMDISYGESSPNPGAHQAGQVNLDVCMETPD